TEVVACSERALNRRAARSRDPFVLSRPAIEGFRSQSNTRYIDVSQKQSHLPRPLVIRIQAHERLKLGEPGRAGQKIRECHARQRTERDFEFVLALPRR